MIGNVIDEILFETQTEVDPFSEPLGSIFKLTGSG